MLVEDKVARKFIFQKTIHRELSDSDIIIAYCPSGTPGNIYKLHKVHTSDGIKYAWIGLLGMNNTTTDRYDSIYNAIKAIVNPWVVSLVKEVKDFTFVLEE